MASSGNPPYNANNLKQTPIPVVSRQMPIVDSTGRVTRSGQLLLEQLQASAAGGQGEPGPPGPTAPDAPNVTIVGPAEITFLNDQTVQIDVEWAPGSSADATNFAGVAAYLEDPDISSGSTIPLDGTVAMNGSGQMSGQWAPVFENDFPKSPVIVFPNGQKSYQSARNVRIYLASYGPSKLPALVRANQPNPTPNIMVEVPQGPGQYQSGMEWAFLITTPLVAVSTNFNRPDPTYYLTFYYNPPDPATPLPMGVNGFGGVRIVYVQETNGVPQFPGTDSGFSIPVAQSQTGYQSPVYNASSGGSTFRAYFCSEDNSLPLGNHINTLVLGVTPYVEVVVPPFASAGAPEVTNFTIDGGSSLDVEHTDFVWQLSGTFTAEATFAWDLPASSSSGAMYAGVVLYLVDVVGAEPGQQNLTAFPKALTSQQSNIDTGFVLQVLNIPSVDETWTIAAISVDIYGNLSDNPSNYGQPGFNAPTVTWTIGPPLPGSPGGGEEYAPLVTINPGATATATQSISADGVGMVSFQVGSWTDPTSNQFGGAQVAMVINDDPTTPTYWSVPGSQTSFTTPAMPSFGNIGQAVPVDFYIVSDDPQGNKNSLRPGVTPVIDSTYTPQPGAIIPARSGWFDASQFQWPASGQFNAYSFAAQVIEVGATLIVGGAPQSFGGPGGANAPPVTNGQIAVMNSSDGLVGWIGTQQPEQGSGAPLYGAWFGQLWVGGSDPLTAPLFIDNQGIIEVGGIAAVSGSKYPYLSVRDDTGLEMGRIGASITEPTGLPGDNTGSTPPPGLTAGAWFTQLAVGGQNLSDWNVLIIPAENPPPTFPPTAGGSNFYMRDINLLSISYPEVASPAPQPWNYPYQLEFGSSVWYGYGYQTYQFPGLRIFEVDSTGSNFGCTLLNRGLVLRGPYDNGNPATTYPTLASLVMWNGDPGGSDAPVPFWAELALFSPNWPYNPTVLLASGNRSTGDGQMAINGASGNQLFLVDTAGVTVGTTLCINTLGEWVGAPISGGGGGGTPGGASGNVQYNNGSGGFAGNGNLTTDGASLTVAGNITADLSFWAGGGFYGQDFGINGGPLCINNSAQFVGTGGVNTTNNVWCANVYATGSLDCDGVVNPVQGVDVNGTQVINNGAQFVGPGGVYTTGNVTCNDVDSVSTAATQWIGAGSGYMVGGSTVIDGSRNIYAATVTANQFNVAGGNTGVSYNIAWYGAPASGQPATVLHEITVENGIVVALS